MRPTGSCPNDGVVLRRKPGTRFAETPLAELASVPDERIVFDGFVVAAPGGRATDDEPMIVEVPQASPYFPGDFFYGRHFSIFVDGAASSVVTAPFRGPVVRRVPARLAGSAIGPDAPLFSDLEGQTLRARGGEDAELVVIEVDDEPCEGGAAGASCAADTVLLELDTSRAEPGSYLLEVPCESGDAVRVNLELRIEDAVPVPAQRAGE